LGLSLYLQALRRSAAELRAIKRRGGPAGIQALQHFQRRLLQDRALTTMPTTRGSRGRGAARGSPAAARGRAPYRRPNKREKALRAIEQGPTEVANRSEYSEFTSEVRLTTFFTEFYKVVFEFIIYKLLSYSFR